MSAMVIHINPKDNVLVALRNLAKGERIAHNGIEYILKENIPAKHKFFMHDMTAGQEILMYGVLIGKTVSNVVQGERMTTTNVAHSAQPYSYRKTSYSWQAPDTSKFRNRTFNGYHRSDGRVGTANYWLFIPTVFCENRNLEVIKDAFQNELGYSSSEIYRLKTKRLIQSYLDGEDISAADLDVSETVIPANRIFKNIDGIKFLTHQGGCGGTRQDAAILGKLLAAYANHPNVGGVTILSLGCQNLQLQDFVNDLKQLNPGFNRPLFIFEQQQLGTEKAIIDSAIKKTFEGLIELNKTGRKPATLDKLSIGVKCGGSDGFSGISANPAVGYCSDLVVALGGKILLAEFPELCGVEQELIDRCTNEQSARKFIRLMDDYKLAAERVGSGFHMNPSPGNIKDGLITDAMKSAGAAKKGGTSPVVDVLDYTEPATEPGLSLVCTPGNDVEATTAKAAAGATLILFTTGLGTPTGNPVAPVIKVSTNTQLAKRMSDIIDIDTGAIIEGTKTIGEMGEEILEYCIKAAGGEVLPKSVLLNQDDFIPWKRGVSL